MRLSRVLARARARAGRYSPSEGKMKFRRFGRRATCPVTEIFAPEKREKTSELEVPRQVAAGFFFPFFFFVLSSPSFSFRQRETSTWTCGLLLSAVIPDEFQTAEGTGGGGRIMLSSWIAAPLCAVNSRRLNCPPDEVTCRYAAYIAQQLATFIRVMKNLDVRRHKAKRS